MARPFSSYAYPRIWAHMEEMGFYPSARSFIRLKNETMIQHRQQIYLSNRTIESKFDPHKPNLFDYDVGHDAVLIVNSSRLTHGLYQITEAQELVRFDCRIVSPEFHSDRINEFELAEVSGYAPVVAEAALQGRLLPRRVCEDLRAAFGSLGVEASRVLVETVPPGEKRNFRPFADRGALGELLKKLAVRGPL
jgi:hypothetical protein